MPSQSSHDIKRVLRITLLFFKSTLKPRDQTKPSETNVTATAPHLPSRRELLSVASGKDFSLSFSLSVYTFIAIFIFSFFILVCFHILLSSSTFRWCRCGPWPRFWCPGRFFMQDFANPLLFWIYSGYVFLISVNLMPMKWEISILLCG